MRIRNLQVLADAAWMPQLRSLRIRDDHSFGIDYVLRACHLPALTKLVIENTVLESTLAVLGNLPELESLELLCDHSDAVVRARGFETLKRLAVRGGVGDTLLAALRERWEDRVVVVNRN